VKDGADEAAVETVAEETGSVGSVVDQPMGNRRAARVPGT
jgi:hypothetical protein